MTAEERIEELQATLFRCLVDVTPEDTHRKTTRNAIAIARYAVKLLRELERGNFPSSLTRLEVDSFLRTGVVPPEGNREGMVGDV